jgi:hypothetical protein
MVSRRLQDNNIELILKSDSKGYSENEGDTEQEEPVTSYWELPCRARNTRSVHCFTGCPSGTEQSNPLHKYKFTSSKCLPKCFQFFLEVTKLLVFVTNLYSHRYLDSHDETSAFSTFDVTEFSFCFFAAITQMGHIQDGLTDYWATMGQYCTPFSSNIIR